MLPRDPQTISNKNPTKSLLIRKRKGIIQNSPLVPLNSHFSNLDLLPPRTDIILNIRPNIRQYFWSRIITNDYLRRPFQPRYHPSKTSPRTQLQNFLSFN